MKKYLILLLFTASVVTSTAQSFNPYRFFKQHQANSSKITKFGKSFLKAIASCNYQMPVHHGVTARVDTFAKSNAYQFWNYVSYNYQGKALSMLDGLSLLYSFVDNAIPNVALEKTGNHFLIDCNGTLVDLMVGWSTIQQKWIMLPIEDGDREKMFLQKTKLSMFSEFAKEHTTISHATVFYQ